MYSLRSQLDSISSHFHLANAVSLPIFGARARPRLTCGKIGLKGESHVLFKQIAEDIFCATRLR